MVRVIIKVVRLAVFLWGGAALDLISASLYGASLVDASFTRSRFMFANLMGSDIAGAVFVDTDLTGVSYGDTICPDGTLSDPPSDSSASCAGHF